MTTHWHSDGNQIHATRHGVTVSVEAPITGSYTNAKQWLGLVRLAITALKSKLVVEEWREKL